jgi:hypothetical protein
MIVDGGIELNYISPTEFYANYNQLIIPLLLGGASALNLSQYNNDGDGNSPLPQLHNYKSTPNI